MKRKKILLRLACAALACALLTGCDRIPLSIFDLVDMIGDSLESGGDTVAENLAPDLTEPLEPGENTFALAPYPLSGNGLAPLLEAVEARLGRSLCPMYNVGSFTLRVDPKGELIGAQVTVCEYLGTPAVYQGGFAIDWDGTARRLSYQTLGTLYDNDPTGYQNDNLTLEFVDGALAQLPMETLRQQMPSGLVISFTPYDHPQADTPVVDMSNPPASLEQQRYQAGDYGTSDGGPRWTLRVSPYDGDQPEWLFCYPLENPDQWVGYPDRYTRRDIRVLTGGLEYTRDWGETWQAIPDDDAALVSECTDAYTGVTRSSWYLSPEPDGPAAFLLGSGATLVWTMDGTSWQKHDFYVGDVKVDRRTAGMLPDGNGFVSYGGEWTMGSGGFCELWFTHDGGETWTQAPTMPESRSICGAAMLEDGSLMVSTETTSDNNWPNVYVTTDDGATWQQLNMPWTDAQMADLSWLYRLDSLTQDESGTLHACFTQEPMGNLAAEFTADTLTGYWGFSTVLHQQS